MKRYHYNRVKGEKVSLYKGENLMLIMSIKHLNIYHQVL